MNNYITTINGIATTVENMDPDAFSSLIELFQYKGFDPLLVACCIEKRGKDKGLSEREIRTDIRDMCALLITRGTDIIKHIEKTDTAGKQRIVELKNRYKIQRSAKNQGPETISMARIGAAFPLICGVLANHLKLEPKMNGFNCKMAPPAFFLPQIAAVFPKNEMGQQLLDIFQHVVIAFTRMVTKDFILDVHGKKAIEYMHIQHNSRVGDDKTREAWCIQLGFYEQGKKTDLILKVYKGMIREANVDGLPST